MDYQQSGLSGYFSALLESFMRPDAIIGICVLLVLMVLALNLQSFKWVVLGMLLFIVTMDTPVRTGYLQVIIAPFPFPLNVLGQYGRPLSLALMFILLVVAVWFRRGWRPRLVPGWAMALYILQMFLCIRMLATDDFFKGVVGILTFSLALVALVIGMSKWLQDINDVRACVRALVLTALLLLLASVYLLVYTPSLATTGTRFMGSTSNPQQAAMFIAMLLPSLFYVILSGSEAKPFRLFCGGATALMLVFLLWTGSRTGALMLTVEMLLIFRLKLGRMLFVALILGSSLLVVQQVFPESQIGVERVLSTTDTRTANWEALWRDFIENPVFGIASMKTHAYAEENSYLKILARTGIFGLVSISAVIYLLFKGVWNLQRARRALGADVLLADVVTATVAGVMVASVFEGVLTGLLTLSIFILYISLGLMGFLVDYAGRAYSPSASQPFVSDHILEAV